MAEVFRQATQRCAFAGKRIPTCKEKKFSNAESIYKRQQQGLEGRFQPNLDYKEKFLFIFLRPQLRLQFWADFHWIFSKQVEKVFKCLKVYSLHPKINLSLSFSLMRIWREVGFCELIKYSNLSCRKYETKWTSAVPGFRFNNHQNVFLNGLNSNYVFSRNDQQAPPGPPPRWGGMLSKRPPTSCLGTRPVPCSPPSGSTRI